MILQDSNQITIPLVSVRENSGRRNASANSPNVSCFRKSGCSISGSAQNLLRGEAGILQHGQVRLTCQCTGDSGGPGVFARQNLGRDGLDYEQIRCGENPSPTEHSGDLRKSRGLVRHQV